MTLLEHYLEAVRMYLPKGTQQDDIISELSEHLQSTLDEKEVELGRPLTELEQEALLAKHGNPMMVAGRYGAKQRSIALGWQLIGPELFPLYVRILALNWTLTIIIPPAIGLFFEKAMPTPGRVLYLLVLQFVIVTVIFTGIDAFERRSRRGTARLGEASNWRFPPSYLQPIPRWQSVAGMVVLGTAALWWAAIPHVPALILGRAAAILQLSPSWSGLYWPVLVLFVVGVAQRATNFVRPDWNWLQAITRLLTNGAAVAMLYPFVRSYPFIVVGPSAPDAASAELIALRINGAIWWTTLASFSIYWLFNAGFHVWLCLQHLRYALRRRSEAVQ